MTLMKWAAIPNSAPPNHIHTGGVTSFDSATDVGTPSEAFEQSYAVGALMYEWVIGTYGFEGYKKLINEFATVTSFSQAVQTAFGIKKEELYEQLADYVYKSYQKVYSK